MHPLTSRYKNQPSTYQLLSLRKSIESKSAMESQLKEQLKLSKQSSQNFLSQITHSIFSTQQNGLSLVNVLQQEKCKHQSLQSLVSHYQKEIQKQKLDKHDSMGNLQNTLYEQLNQELEQRQSLLQALTGKLNTSECEKMKKYELVKAQRRERTVFSNQFNTFQNQLFDLEYKYKQHVIERYLLQKKFDQQVHQFQKIQKHWTKQLQLLKNTVQKPHQIPLINTKPNFSLHGLNDDIDSRQYRGLPLSDNLKGEVQFLRTRSKLNYVKMEKSELVSRTNLFEERKINNLAYLKEVKQMLHQLGVERFDQVKELFDSKDEQQSTDKFATLQQLNQQLLQQLHDLDTQLHTESKSIDTLKTSLSNLRTPTRPKPHKANLTTLTKLITSAQSSYQQELQSFRTFTQSENLCKLKAIIKLDSLVVNSQNGQQNTQFPLDTHLFQQIQDRLCKVMGHLNPHNIRFRQDHRQSLLLQNPFQHFQKQPSVSMTQRTICPLLQPIKPLKKRTKTANSQQFSSHVKKLSNVLKNQSKLKGPTQISTKQQLIKQALKAFDKEDIENVEKFWVKYQ